MTAATVKPDLASKETAVVGTLLAECPDQLPPHCARLIEHAPESFDDLRHAAIALAIRQLRAAGKPIALLTVREQLLQTGKLDEAGGILYLESLAAQAVSVDLAEFEAEPLWQAYQLRRTKSALSEAAAALESAPAHAANILAATVATLQSLTAHSREEKPQLTIRSPDEILAQPQDQHDNILGDRLLAKGQSLTLLGPGGIGKSRMLLQWAAASIAGEPFIGLETHGEALRWLVFQLENANRRLQSDLDHLRSAFRNHWQAINERLAIHTLETDRDGWLSLDAEENQFAIAETIEAHKPDVVVFDPLNQFAIGDPNKDQDMAATCQAIARLCRKGNPQRAISILHHTITGRAGAAKSFGMERAGYGRNSKVLQAWTRGQINLAPISEDNNDVLAVLCGKCSNGREFPPFAVRLNHDSMLYEVAPDVDMDAWRADVAGKHAQAPAITTERVKELCKGSMAKKDLARAIMEDAGCARSYAYRMIEKAQHARAIHYSKATEKYVAKP